MELTVLAQHQVIEPDRCDHANRYHNEQRIEKESNAAPFGRQIAADVLAVEVQVQLSSERTCKQHY